MNSILLIEEHNEEGCAARLAARLVRFGAPARGAGAAAFVSKRELPHGLMPILGRIGL